MSNQTKPALAAAHALIRNRAQWAGEDPNQDPWGFLISLSMDLAEHLYHNEWTVVDGFSAGAGALAMDTAQSYRDEFRGWSVDLLLAVANGPFADMRQRLIDEGLDS